MRKKFFSRYLPPENFPQRESLRMHHAAKMQKKTLERRFSSAKGKKLTACNNF